MANQGESVLQQDTVALPVEDADVFYTIRGIKDRKVTFADLKIYKRVEIAISSAQFLLSNAEPILVILPPGVGSYIDVKSATLINQDPGVQYNTLGNSSVLSNSSLANDLFDFGSACTQSANQFIVGGVPAALEEILEDESIVFRTLAGNPILGTRTFKLIVHYTVELIA